MKVLTFSDTLAAAAKGLGKWCIYVGIHYTIEEEAEILKAAPWLTKLDSFDLTGFIMDGGGIIAFNSEQEMLDAYENTVGEDGPYLEETEAAVRAELEDLAKTKTMQFLEDIQEGRFDIADEESVMEMREEGLSDEVIAAQLAEDDVAEYDAAHVGIDADGNVWTLDDDEQPRTLLQRPDR